MRSIAAGAVVAGVGLIVSSLATRKTHENERQCLDALQRLEDASKKLQSIPDRKHREELTLGLANASEALTTWLNSWFPTKLRIPNLTQIDELVSAIDDAAVDDIAFPTSSEEELDE